MRLFKNQVGRPLNETIKKRNVFKGLYLLMFIIIIILVIFILNDKGFIKINKHDTNNQKKRYYIDIK